MKLADLVLSHFQARPLLEQRENMGSRITFSPDLGLSTIEGQITSQGVEIHKAEILGWTALSEICDHPNNCFTLADGIPTKIITFSPLTNSSYSLYPTAQAPTMLISGTE